MPVRLEPWATIEEHACTQDTFKQPDLMWAQTKATLHVQEIIDQRGYLAEREDEGMPHCVELLGEEHGIDEAVFRRVKSAVRDRNGVQHQGELLDQETIVADIRAMRMFCEALGEQNVETTTFVPQALVALAVPANKPKAEVKLWHVALGVIGIGLFFAALTSESSRARRPPPSAFPEPPPFPPLPTPPRVTPAFTVPPVEERGDWEGIGCIVSERQRGRRTALLVAIALLWTFASVVCTYVVIASRKSTGEVPSGSRTTPPKVDNQGELLGRGEYSEDDHDDTTPIPYLRKGEALQVKPGSSPYAVMKKRILETCPPVYEAVLSDEAWTDGSELACSNGYLPERVPAGARLKARRNFFCPARPYRTFTETQRAYYSHCGALE